MQAVPVVFIRAISAVIFIITLECASNASPILALELSCLTSYLATFFIRAISTIYIAITSPLFVNAMAHNFAVELIRTARRIAVGLITAILTVELSVAMHGSLDAPPIRTLKLVVQATSAFAVLLI